MNTLIIGAGSIGKRHAENAARFSDHAAIFDLDTNKKNEIAHLFGMDAPENMADALSWGATHIVIATPHHTHIAIAEQCLDAQAQHILIEKPISNDINGVETLLEKAQQKGKHIYVVCNMRFHPAIKMLRQHLPEIGTPLYARAQYGNYLPNMRPNADYKTLYCAHKEQGGGVILDAIHEIDYLSWLFGRVNAISCEADKRSDLDINVEDYAAINLTHESRMRSEIHLDYLQQCKRRGCEIIGTDGTLIWYSEGKQPEHCTVRLFRKSTGAWETVFEDKDLDASGMYAELMQKFLSGDTQDFLSGTNALIELRSALAAHKSAQTGQRQEIGE